MELQKFMDAPPNIEMTRADLSSDIAITAQYTGGGTS